MIECYQRIDLAREADCRRVRRPHQHRHLPRDISAYLMPKDWLETLEAVGLTNADLLRRCVSDRLIQTPTHMQVCSPIGRLTLLNNTSYY